MSTRTGLNKNNSAVKRIMQEARELANDPCTDYAAAPLEDDIFEWHCTLRGPSGTEFEGGLYHFRILLPAEYPFRPPSIMMLTPNGRFELNTKICISFTNYHEELWQPAWGVRTAIIGLQGFFPLRGTAAVGVGALEYPTPERKRLAVLSRDWVCPTCQRTNLGCLPDPPTAATSLSNPDTPVAADISVSQPIASVPAPVISADSISSPPASSQLSAADIPSSSPGAPTTRSIPAHSIPLIAPIPTRPSPPAPILIDRIPTPPVEEVRPSSAKPETSHPAPQPPADLPALAAAITQSSRRPPVVLDTAICVLLVLAIALLAKRVF
ncbi:uncharacterized protein FIBRA_04999 [Fibroporia radiculosa]|uniref:UBC core domain-containing protein n=1 Tax=Fibroporia radiculosa TaxID=599839 RepID=J4GQ83_9APHY|nr:uncharacterized protein FIBRA_04999 [Fibroporia radiculosa]CCM02885.1 predicted protein [Fibroporia radiculosa]